VGFRDLDDGLREARAGTRRSRSLDRGAAALVRKVLLRRFLDSLVSEC